MDMNVKVVVHKKLSAREILDEALWKANYSYFNEEQHKNGIYFYTYNSSKVPYYIGMSAAKSYNILGRVWSELNDYQNGRYYMPKEPDQLSNLECFKSECSPESFFIPGDYDKDDKYFQEMLKKLLDNTDIIFSFLEMIPEVESKDIKDIFFNIEAIFQTNIVKAMKLQPKWIGDKGRGYFTDQKYNYKINIVFKDPYLENTLDTRLLLGK